MTLSSRSGSSVISPTHDVLMSVARDGSAQSHARARSGLFRGMLTAEAEGYDGSGPSAFAVSAR